MDKSWQINKQYEIKAEICKTTCGGEICKQVRHHGHHQFCVKTPTVFPSKKGLGQQYSICGIFYLWNILSGFMLSPFLNKGLDVCWALNILSLSPLLYSNLVYLKPPTGMYVNCLVPKDENMPSCWLPREWVALGSAMAGVAPRHGKPNLANSLVKAPKPDPYVQPACSVSHVGTCM